MLSVVFGIAAIGVVYAIGRTVSGVLTGVLASVLLAFCVHHIYFSLELRMYAIVWFGASLSSLFLLRALRAPNRQGWIFGNVLTNVLLLYTHWFTALLIASQGLFLLVARTPQSLRRAYWFCAHAVAGIGLGAYLLTVDFHALPGFTAWISPVTWREAIFTPIQLLGLNEFAFGQIELPVTWGEVLLPLPIVLLLVAGTVRVALRNGPRSPTEYLDLDSTSTRFYDFLYLAIWALLPTVLLTLMSMLGMKCYVPRYLGHCTVALIVLIAAAVRGCTVRFGLPTGIAVFLVVFGCYGYRYITIERPFRTDFATIADMSRKDIRPDDRILMVPAWQDDILNYYLKIDRSRYSTAHQPSEIVKKLNELKSPGRSIWMVVVGGGPKRADRNLGYTMEALGITGDSVRPQRIRGYYRAYVLRIPGGLEPEPNGARLGAS